ncbi:MAG TPA: hypothetical protein VGV61_13970 [Thermoanaerobaculia bacterium]|nr:hypothetical protein [Thermoanaerobaculia bacterium]
MTRRLLPSLRLTWPLLPTLLFVACSKPPEAAPAPAPAANGVGAAPAANAPAPAEQPPVAAATAPAGGVAGAPAAGAPAQVIASQDTNWAGVVAEVLEFRRKGNTLTAKVRLRNGGPDKRQVEVKYDETYLMDTGNAKKYEVLRDEKGTYIAALRSGWADRWYDTLEPTESYLLWIKFPAPPPEVKAVTLQVPGTPPFEDLAIQDG